MYCLMSNERIVHLARNPIVGGMPARFTRMIMEVHSLCFEKSSSLILAWFILLSIVTIKINEVQYNARKYIRVLRFMKIAIIIQLRLKIDEKARISRMFFLLIWEDLPKMAVSRSDTVMMGLRRYIIR